mmetsp:Transcript_8098/g.20185  ORF Transcript_8098/g.20185 Transcript_8098/m.20185 type:complete len:711 (-) Transcript_8098:59-2191(-)
MSKAVDACSCCSMQSLLHRPPAPAAWPLSRGRTGVGDVLASRCKHQPPSACHGIEHGGWRGAAGLRCVLAGVGTAQILVASTTQRRRPLGYRSVVVACNGGGPGKSEPSRTLSDEDALWRQAYDAETARASLLAADAVDVHDSDHIREVVDPRWGWRAAYEALRARNDALQQASQARQASRTDAAAVEPPDGVGAVAAQRLKVDDRSAGPGPREAPREQEDFFKAYSLFTIPVDVDPAVADDAIELVDDTEFPLLKALYGDSCSPERSTEKLPTSAQIRAALALDDADFRDKFRADAGARDYCGRVFEVRGRMLVGHGGEARTASDVLSLLQKRLEVSLLAETEVFMQPDNTELDVSAGERWSPVRLFVFLRHDLPRPGVASAVSWIQLPAGAAVVALCNDQLLSDFGLVPVDATTLGDAMLAVFVDPPAIQLEWLLGPLLLLPLLASMAARQAVARSHGVAGTHIPIPLPSFGHLGSLWSPADFLPSRAAGIDIALAGPSASLFVSAVLLWYGIQHTNGMDPSEIPFEIPAAQLPTALARFLGYNPEPAGLPLLTLGASPGSEWLSPSAAAEALVPADPFLLSGALGLSVSALSLLPLGGFDGYTAARLSFGMEAAAALELISLGALLKEVDVFEERGPCAFEVVVAYVVCSILVPHRVLNAFDQEMPPRNGVTAPGIERQALVAALLVGCGAILAPPQPYWSALQPYS